MIMGRLFMARTKVHKNFMKPTLKWKKDVGRESRVSPSHLLEDGPLDGLNEFLVTKTVDNWVDQWC